MKKIKIFLSVLTLSLLISSCTKNDVLQEKTMNNEDLELFTSSDELRNCQNFEVSQSLLTKYLNLFKDCKNVKKIEEIEENGIKLAYYIEYTNNDGWKIIAADQRISPVLASCPEGSLDLSDANNPAIQAIRGMVVSVKNVKEEKSNSQKNRIWEVLNPTHKTDVKKLSSTKTRKNLLRGFGIGMWVAVDTTYEFATINSPRVTSTAWGQGSPWHNYTPYFDYNQNNCPVGCLPVAVGQIIYKYIAPSPGQLTIPADATVYTTPFANVSFSNPSTTIWSYLIPNAYGNNLYFADTTAIFLSWLGSRMGANYSADSTGASIWGARNVLDDYVIYDYETSDINANSYPETKEFFCTMVISSIDNNSPLLIASYSQNGGGHAFLIDGYSTVTDRLAIRYVFDPNYEYTYEELSQLPLWMFEYPADYGNPDEPCEMYDYINLEQSLYIKMNWGWQNQSSSPNYNNYSYLLRYQTTYVNGGQNITSSLYNFSWTPGSVTYSNITEWFHHFVKKTQN